MNPETERRLAALIMEEANMMRRQAERDGVGAYLLKPVIKARPNRQFLNAMVRNVQQGKPIHSIMSHFHSARFCSPFGLS